MRVTLLVRRKQWYVAGGILDDVLLNSLGSENSTSTKIQCQDVVHTKRQKLCFLSLFYSFVWCTIRFWAYCNLIVYLMQQCSTCCVTQRAQWHQRACWAPPSGALHVWTGCEGMLIFPCSVVCPSVHPFWDQTLEILYILYMETATLMWASVRRMHVEPCGCWWTTQNADLFIWHEAESQLLAWYGCVLFRPCGHQSLPHMFRHHHLNGCLYHKFV